MKERMEAFFDRRTKASKVVWFFYAVITATVWMLASFAGRFKIINKIASAIEGGIKL